MSRATFGQYLRAARLGYHRVKTIDAWVRISDAHDDRGSRWRIDVAEGLVPGRETRPKNHRVWWEVEGGEARLLEAIPLLATIRERATLPHTFYVDDGGEEINP